MRKGFIIGIILLLIILIITNPSKEKIIDEITYDLVEAYIRGKEKHGKTPSNIAVQLKSDIIKNNLNRELKTQSYLIFTLGYYRGSNCWIGIFGQVRYNDKVNRHVKTLMSL